MRDERSISTQLVPRGGESLHCSPKAPCAPQQLEMGGRNVGFAPPKWFLVTQLLNDDRCGRDRTPYGRFARSDGAPAAIHCWSVAISSGNNRPTFLGGISPARTRLNTRLSSGWPGIRPGPDSPPLRIDSRERRSRPDSCLCSPWHRTHFAFSRACARFARTARSESTGPEAAGPDGAGLGGTGPRGTGLGGTGLEIGRSLDVGVSGAGGVGTGGPLAGVVDAGAEKVAGSEPRTR